MRGAGSGDSHLHRLGARKRRVVRGAARAVATNSMDGCPPWGGGACYREGVEGSAIEVGSMLSTPDSVALSPSDCSSRQKRALLTCGLR